MQRKSLARDQCALFKVQSPRRLAEKVLRFSLDDLRRLAHNGVANYEVYDDENTGRWIESPSEKLKKVQRRIHDLLAQITPPEYLYSGVKGRSAVGNAVRHFDSHRKSVAVVKLDIAKFYPSSDGNRVGHFFYQAMQCSQEVAELLCGLTTIPATSASTHLHLPTGGVTSQILGYYSYEAMFKALAALAANSNTVLSVLVDDITFSGAGATPGLLNEARQIVHRFGLRSKRKKEKVLNAGSAKIVTGVALTDSGPRLTQFHRQNIHQLQKRLNDASSPEEKAVLAQRLFGTLSYAGQIEPRYREQSRVLHRKLKAESATWEAMHREPAQNKNSSRAKLRGQLDWFRGAPGFKAARLA